LSRGLSPGSHHSDQRSDRHCEGDITMVTNTSGRVSNATFGGGDFLLPCTLSAHCPHFSIHPCSYATWNNLLYLDHNHVYVKFGHTCTLSSVWGEVQICIWLRWWHCMPFTVSWSRKSRLLLVLPFWYRLTRVAWTKSREP